MPTTAPNTSGPRWIERLIRAAHGANRLVIENAELGRDIRKLKKDSWQSGADGYIRLPHSVTTAGELEFEAQLVFRNYKN
jgi:hypothetical protein